MHPPDEAGLSEYRARARAHEEPHRDRRVKQIPAETVEASRPVGADLLFTLGHLLFTDQASDRFLIIIPRY